MSNIWEIRRMTLADDRHNISSPCYDDDLQFFRAIRQTRERQKKILFHISFGQVYEIILVMGTLLSSQKMSVFMQKRRTTFKVNYLKQL